mmetsp:Transcript_13618/g.32579  ORF Transcript_13618/g.32579 Transcript_13618/m.32579 type:complete len:89 (+) Transcript_13618:494-760(+)
MSCTSLVTLPSVNIRAKSITKFTPWCSAACSQEGRLLVSSYVARACVHPWLIPHRATPTVFTPDPFAQSEPVGRVELEQSLEELLERL